jgi:hypothetical protein
MNMKKREPSGSRTRCGPTLSLWGTAGPHSSASVVAEALTVIAQYG